MKGMSRTISTLALSLMALGAVPSANAALRAVGPLSAVHGLPVWYQDVAGLTLQPCLDQVAASPTGTGLLCVLPLPDAIDPLGFDTVVNPAAHVITTTPGAILSATNFPAEFFYWIADAAPLVDPVLTGGLPLGTAVKFKLRMAMEGTAAVPPLAAPIAFMRINLQKIAGGLVPGGVYTVSLPLSPGADLTFTANADGSAGGVGGVFAGQVFRNQIDALAAPFNAILPGIFPALAPIQPTPITMDNFLVWDPAVLPAAPVGFIGDPTVPHAVVKAGDTVPAVVRFSGPGLPAGGLVISQLNLAGKTFGMDVKPGTTFNLGANKIVTPVPAPQTVTITNRTGSQFTFADLNLPATKAGVDAADFIAAPSTTLGAAPFCTGIVAIGASCSFDIVFTPTASVPAHAARTATITLAPAATPPVPPVVLTLSGTAQVIVTASAPVGQHGAVTPATQTVGAGATVNLTLTPDNKKFKVKELVDVAGANAGVTVLTPFAINAGNLNHAVTATFMPSGDLDQDGVVTVNDALRALRLVVGVPVVPVKAADDDAAMILAPLVAGVPAPVVRTAPNLGDVLVILRRAVGLENW